MAIMLIGPTGSAEAGEKTTGWVAVGTIEVGSTCGGSVATVGWINSIVGPGVQLAGISCKQAVSNSAVKMYARFILYRSIL